MTHTPSNLNVAPTSATNSFTQTFTQDDLERARKQEKDKLYPQLEQMRAELAALQKERDDKAAAEEAARKDAEAEAKRKTDAETDVRSLLEQKQAEWESQLTAERTAREEALAVLNREREYNDLVAYRQAAVAANADNIIPDLIDMVDGSTAEEIDASIARLAAKSQSIIEAAGAATQSARQAQRGASITAPPVGPMDTTSDSQTTLSPQDIAAMPMSEYVKHRAKLMGAASAQRDRGLFG